MEEKKSPKADLQRDILLNLLLGLLVAISVVYVALQWRSNIDTDLKATSGLSIEDIDDQLLIMDEQQPEETPPEPEVQQQVEVQLPEEFKVVENTKEVQKFQFQSADENKPAPPPPPPGPVEEEDAEQIFEVVEQQPEFPGGTAALMKWLSSNIHYPEIAAENGVQGRVVVRFVVEKDGSASDVKVVRGVDPALDKEAVRVVKAMPKWKPGMQRGKNVRTRFTLPVVFRLQ